MGQCGGKASPWGALSNELGLSWGCLLSEMQGRGEAGRGGGCGKARSLLGQEAQPSIRTCLAS